MDPDVLERFAPDITLELSAFETQTTQQLGRPGNAILLRKSLADSLQPDEHIIF
ncbi:hypothetical protein [Limnofasciculus baicalensis]|uniref:Uncharacterized protein n=1 Tax=Limnofasciculus baicalensis BBK-W-15 TaxID=2699891 RepID=A0AAE3KPM4_9CYAN|nr:hypothetical protein [Limnofasciculus baicalensis]MCP2731504.1 hypothetical protein [Limnofasciculus baicalensis BBK-W-15]